MITLAVVVELAFRAAAIAYVLRHAPRSAVPFPREGAVKRAATAYSAERIWVIIFIVFLLVPASVFVVRDDSPCDQAAMIAGSLAAAVYTCIFAARVFRAKAVMARDPSPGNGA